MPHKWKDKDKSEISYRPDSKPGIIWGQELGDPECPYMKRWVINFGKFAIRLHHWIGSDDPRNFHDHAWGFYTFVLKGGYTDVSEKIIPDSDYGSGWGPYFDEKVIVKEHLGAGSLTYRPAHHKHTVQTDPSGAWTILVNGPHVRKWGFWVDGKFIKVREYFRKFGHHPCMDDEQA